MDDDIEPYDKYDDNYVNPNEFGQDPVTPGSVSSFKIKYYELDEEESDSSSDDPLSEDESTGDDEPEGNNIIPKKYKRLKEELWDKDIKFFSF